MRHQSHYLLASRATRGRTDALFIVLCSTLTTYISCATVDFMCTVACKKDLLCERETFCISKVGGKVPRPMRGPLRSQAYPHLRRPATLFGPFALLVPLPSSLRQFNPYIWCFYGVSVLLRWYAIAAPPSAKSAHLHLLMASSAPGGLMPPFYRAI